MSPRPRSDEEGHPPCERLFHRLGPPRGRAGALLAGAVFLSSILYMFGYLAHLGLTVEMLDRPAELLPWIADHTRAHLGL